MNESKDEFHKAIDPDSASTTHTNNNNQWIQPEEEDTESKNNDDPCLLLQDRQVIFKWSRTQIGTNPLELIQAIAADFGSIQRVQGIGNRGNLVKITFESPTSCGPCVDAFKDNEVVRAFFVGTRRTKKQKQQTTITRNSCRTESAPNVEKGEVEIAPPIPDQDKAFPEGMDVPIELSPEEQDLSRDRPQPQEIIGAFGVVRSTESGALQLHPPGYNNSSQSSADTSLHNNPIIPAAVTVNEQEEEERLRNAERQGRQAILRQAVQAQVVAPQLLTRQNLQMPKFPPELEDRFQIEHNMLLVSVLRIFRPIAMTLNWAFFLWDILQPDAPLLACFWVIALSLVVFYTTTRIAERYPKGRAFQWAMCLAIWVIAAQISTTMLLVQNGFVIAAGGYGIILVPCSCCMRFWYALVFNAGTMGIGNVLALVSFFVGKTSYELHYVLIHLNMFMGTYCVFGVFFSYVMELHFRQRFRDAGTNFGWTDNDTAFNEQATAEQSAELLLASEPSQPNTGVMDTV